SLFDIAADIRRPALLMVGERDDGFDMYAGVKRLHALMPEAKLVVFRDAGHSLVCERTDALIGELREFLAGTTDAR
ncbi:MAG TPA: alpha/beta hydrolase, partial [Patescibacteria group bacterium]|nr:alpha/beta hydrolase [Patescibacteria group bacterium]